MQIGCNRPVYFCTELLINPKHMHAHNYASDKIRAILEQFRASVRTGSPQVYDRLVVLPVWAPHYNEPAYITLEEALEAGCLQLSEVSDKGSVPYIKADNGCDQKVLLAEGEEIKGAKQNRTFNTSILLPARTQVIIPVSCTERGRWRSESARFADTDAWIPAHLRHRKLTGVHRHLKHRTEFLSDQSDLWDDIDEYARRLKARSDTKALHDLIKTRRKDLNRMLQYFERREKQTGLVVFMDGYLIGADILTNRHAFARLYPKILKSYLLDYLARPRRDGMDTFLDLPKRWRFDTKDAHQKFMQFLDLAFTGELRDVRSPGLGTDIRMESTHVSGFALAYSQKVIHMVLLRNNRRTVFDNRLRNEY